MKKTSLLLVLCMMLNMVIALPAKAAQSGTCGKNLTWTLDDDGTLTISGNGDMYDWGDNPSPFSELADTITSVVIENGVTNVGSSAFEYCENITSVSLPDSVTAINDFAFVGCVQLNNITLSNNLTYIGECAFLGCSGLKNIDIPESVTNIENQAFSYCDGLIDITIPKNVENLDECAFMHSRNLKNINVDVNNNYYSSDDGVLYNKEQSKLIYFPGGAAGNEGMFDPDNPGLLFTTFYISENITDIAYHAFQDCYNLEFIDVSEDNPFYSSIGGVLYNKEQSMLLRFPIARYETLFTIPDSVIEVSGDAFANCTHLTDITISDSVTHIFFDEGYSLLNITVNKNNNNYSSIDGVLYNKDQSELVYYPAGKTDTSFTVPDSVAIIGTNAFQDCENLSEITIPNSVIAIKDFAFGWGMMNLSDVYYDGDEASWNDILISEGNDALLNAAIHFNGSAESPVISGTCGENLIWTLDDNGRLTISGSGNMYDWNHLENNPSPFSEFADNVTSVVIKNGVTNVGSSAFAIFWNVTLISLPDSVTTINDHAFDECYYLTSVTVPNSVTHIGKSAFSNCQNLTDITIPNSVTYIDDSTFFCCHHLTDITIPDSVISIGGAAFSGCENLTNVTVPNSVTHIGESAFFGCESLTNITIPDSVINIGNSAFNGCSNLTNVTIPDGITCIDGGTFYKCSNLTNVTIPDSVTSIDWLAFEGCTGLTDVYYKGTQEQWNEISIGSYNEPLTNAIIHFKNNISKQYTVSFNANGGTTAPVTQEVKEGTDLILPMQTPARVGYTFLGWALTADAQSAAYAAGDTININSDMTLYALWNKTSYTTTSKINGIFIVTPTGITSGSSIILACYKDGRLVNTEEFTYSNESVIPFFVTKAYDRVKVFVWDGIDNMTPITESENI